MHDAFCYQEKNLTFGMMIQQQQNYMMFFSRENITVSILRMINLTKLNKGQVQVSEDRALRQQKVCHQRSESKRTTQSSPQVSRMAVVGAPFEIRIPTKQITYLLEEVQNLKSKCKFLQESIDPEQKVQLNELASSMKKIEQNVNTSTDDLFLGQQVSINEQISSQSDKGMQKKKQTSFPTNYQELLEKLNESQKNVSLLDKKNEKLKEKFNDNQTLLRNIKRQNNLLKEKVKLLLGNNEKNLSVAKQISEKQ